MSEQYQVLTFEEFVAYLDSSTKQNAKTENQSEKLCFLQEILGYFSELYENWERGITFTDDDRIQGYLLNEESELHVFLSDFSGDNREFYADEYGYPTPRHLRERICKETGCLIRQLLFGKNPKINTGGYLSEFKDQVVRNRQNIKSVIFHLFTDLDIPDEPLPEERSHGITFSFNVWSMKDVYQVYLSEHPVSSSNEIDLEKDFAPIPCMPVCFAEDPGYKSYLAVVPGSVLARLYEKYHEKILEGNVRVFLQAKRSVNLGIHKTLAGKKTERQRFFAYNNGLSATAEKVEVISDDSGCRITKVTNLQIVNGGQTTASIHNIWAEKKCSDSAVDGVYVQMKLTEMNDKAALSELMPKISQYSNTQNAISKTDFPSNDAFFKELHRLSREVANPDGSTHWFYERLNGQYGEEERIQAKGDKAKKSEFGIKYPLNHRITKAELGLYYMAWDKRPNLASNGGSKNFNNYIKKLKSENNGLFPQPDPRYFKEMVALALLFRKADNLVKEFYKDLSRKTGEKQSGPKQQIVLYTLSLLSHITNGRFSLLKIWSEQSGSTFDLPAPLENYLMDLILKVRSYFNEWKPGDRIITEWIKEETCWASLRDTRTEYHIPFPPELSSYLLTDADAEAREKWLLSLSPEPQPEEADDAENPVEEKAPPETPQGTETEPVVPSPINPEELRKSLSAGSVMELSKFISDLQKGGVADDKMMSLLKRILAARRARKIPEKKLLDGVVEALLKIEKQNDKTPEEEKTDSSLPETMKENQRQDDSVTHESASTEYVFEGSTKGAVGRLTKRNGNWILLKGSTVSLDDGASFDLKLKKWRDDLINNSVLIRNPDVETATLTEDLPVDSEAIAAKFVAARNQSAQSFWKCNGKTLKEYPELK